MFRSVRPEFLQLISRLNHRMELEQEDRLVAFQVVAQVQQLEGCLIAYQPHVSLGNQASLSAHHRKSVFDPGPDSGDGPVLLPIRPVERAPAPGLLHHHRVHYFPVHLLLERHPGIGAVSVHHPVAPQDLIVGRQAVMHTGCRDHRRLDEFGRPIRFDVVLVAVEGLFIFVRLSGLHILVGAFVVLQFCGGSPSLKRALSARVFRCRGTSTCSH